jgi:hypothetical protein
MGSSLLRGGGHWPLVLPLDPPLLSTTSQGLGFRYNWLAAQLMSLLTLVFSSSYRQCTNPSLVHGEGSTNPGE